MTTKMIISVWGLWIWIVLVGIKIELKRIADALDKHISGKE